MKYGIGLRYFVNHSMLGSNFVGVPCACHASWGLPQLFNSMQEAGEYARRHYGEQTKRSTIWWEVISERAAVLRIGIMVEIVNGRRQYHPSTGEWVIDATKLTYEQMLPLLRRLSDSAERERFRRQNTKPFEYGRMSYTFD